MLRVSSTIAAVAAAALNACSSGGSDSNSGGTGIVTSSSTLLGAPLDADISTKSHSASLDEGTSLVRAYPQTFSFRSRDDYDKDGDVRRIRYGKPFPDHHPIKNYTVPITVSDTSGQTVSTGTATFTGDDVETGVTSRTITLTDVTLSDSLFGLFSTDDTGPRGDFLEIHAYSAGINPTVLPTVATYTGIFMADVISDGAIAATRIELPANLSINFLGMTNVTGTIGAIGAPDITLSGTTTGSDISGTATIATGSVILSAGSTGTFNGAVYGASGSNVAGTLGISDQSGAINHEMVGAFGATQN